MTLHESRGYVAAALALFDKHRVPLDSDAVALLQSRSQGDADACEEHEVEEVHEPTATGARSPSSPAQPKPAAPQCEVARRDINIQIKDLIDHGLIAAGRRRERDSASVPRRSDAFARRARARASAPAVRLTPARSTAAPRARARCARLRSEGHTVRLCAKVQGTHVSGAATLRADGTLLEADGTTHTTASGWSQACIKRAGFMSKTNGWDVTFYDGAGDNNGMQMSAIRRKLDEDLRKAPSA